MISASTLNSELINKIAQDLRKPPVWRLWSSIFTVMRFLNCLISRRFAS